MYFINGTMEAILDNLCKIQDMRVVSRNSVEQYRNNPKPTPVVAEEMDVSYILEGSGHRDKDNVRLYVQLLDGRKDQHLWSKSYEADIEDIFSMQSEIAQLIAKEVEAIITPQEKQLIEKIPTYNLKAYDLYQRAKEEYTSFLFNKIYNREALRRAHDYFQKALVYDSTYAKAYAGLAMIAYSKLVHIGCYESILYDGYLERQAFDSVYYWANLALQYDNQLDEAYLIRGKYYHQMGESGKAEEDFQRAISLNPNQWEAYFRIAEMTYFDMVKLLEYYSKAIPLTRGFEYRYILTQLYTSYHLAGFGEMAQRLIEDYSNQELDSLGYYVKSGMIDLVNDPERSAEYLHKAYDIDSTNPAHLFFAGERMIAAGHVKEGLKDLRTYSEICNSSGIIPYNTMHRIGYYLFQAGYKQEAAYFLDRQEEICKRLIELDRPLAQRGLAQYDLALTYAFRGKHGKAIDQLKMIQNKTSVSLLIARLLFTDPMLDNIRNDPAFQEISVDMSKKYQAEHERVRQWLEENDML